METVYTNIKLKNGTFCFDELRRFFPDAKGERNGDIWTVCFPHPSNIHLVPHHLYSWNGLCRKMGIVSHIPKDKLLKWNKTAKYGDGCIARYEAASYLGKDFYEYSNAFYELSRHECGYICCETLLTECFLREVGNRCGTHAAEQLRDCLCH